MTDPITLAAQVRALRLPRGGVVLVHCGMRRIGTVPGGPRTLLWALRQALGPGGTVVVPAQTAGNSLTSRAYRQATAGMTDAERARYAARRSNHPQTSFAALGPASDEITRVHDLDCHLGERSPLGTLYRLGATVLMIGVEMDTCTALHLAEYRLHPPPPLMTFACL
ncbi:AAC(3) family N-acetyltransferase [Actinoplanes xinjiangensis]|uniref:AAC(3) family N-acetyltransferase n=1 Tax=Actinoplanes xinjiangensis TaxID=512350 RepID=UPI00342741D8